MSLKWSYWLWAVCLPALLQSFTAHAQPARLGAPVNFYSASVPVVSQSVRERERAAAEGLREVLTRVSGTVELDRFPQAAEALAAAASHIEQFQYEQVRKPGTPPAEHLVMTFSATAIERILRTAGLPYWPIQRPDTLVWLVEEDAAEGKRLVNDRNSPVLQGLIETARQRGLPLALPLLDLDDQLAINAELVWNLDEQPILSASERYGADTVLVGRFSESAMGTWSTTWQFFHRGSGGNYDLRGEDAFSLGRQALAPVADFLAGLYALRSRPEGAERLVVQVAPVDSFGAYRKALDYLQKLAVVTSLNLLAVTDQSLLLSLQLNGTLEQLENTLALDAKLRPELRQASLGAPGLSSARGTSAEPLRLEWIGR